MLAGSSCSPEQQPSVQSSHFVSGAGAGMHYGSVICQTLLRKVVECLNPSVVAVVGSMNKYFSRMRAHTHRQEIIELVPHDLISIFNDKELELLINGLPEIDFDDLKAHIEYTGFTSASPIIDWFWDVGKEFNKEDMARFL